MNIHASRYSAYVRLPSTSSRAYHMGMSIFLKEWTSELLNELPDDGNRYEIIDGKLFVTPSPSRVHQRALAELHLLLAPYAKTLHLDLLFAPFAVKFSGRSEVQPDLLVMPPKAD